MSHYNSAYFKWQQNAGEMAGRNNLFLYKPFIHNEDKVVDFGCGGGYLLSNIQCKERLGIEINEDARKQATLNGIKTVENIQSCPDEWANVIISCHALEHTFNPLNEIKSLYPKLKPGGKIIFVVPYERKVKYKPKDINQHLYTWSGMNLGNLFSCAGFSVIKVDEVYHRFPPKANLFIKYFGNKAFKLISHMYGLIRRDITQMRVIAEKA